MSRRVQPEEAKKRKDGVVAPSYPEIEAEDLGPERNGFSDWNTLPDDFLIQLFACLNYRDRASLSSTCRMWRVYGASHCLWSSLDLRAYKFNTAMAASLASRCVNLRKLRFRGAESADAIIHLQAKNLREISGDHCWKITDATLSVAVARHEALESLQLGPECCQSITGYAIKAIAHCCPKLKKLRLSGIKNVFAEAINALSEHCPNLVDIGFLDCKKVDEVALGNILSVRFLSVAGTSNMSWDVVSQLWCKLPKLIGLDVSRTDIDSTAVSGLLSSSQSLKVLCALNCPVLEVETSISTIKTEGKLLVAVFLDIFRGLCSLFAETMKKVRNVFLDWRCSDKKDKNLNEIMTWLEWILSHSLLLTASWKTQGLDDFWLKQGAALLLNLIQSSQEDVQERAATGLGAFVLIDDEDANIDCERAEAVMQDGGIRLLLNLAKSWQEGFQSEAAKAIANLSINVNVAKAVAEEGGINILVGSLRSKNMLVAETAAAALLNLSAEDEHQAAIAEAGGIEALVDLLLKWSPGGDGVLVRAAGALANLAADDTWSVKVVIAGGLHASLMLARNCKFEEVLEEVARALPNLSTHGHAAGRQEVLEVLVQLTSSPLERARQAAAGALRRMSVDDRNQEAIAAAGVVKALVTLAQSCLNASLGLQEMVAGALLGLSVSEDNNVAIVQEGGFAPLIVLAHADAENVNETAAMALMNLASNRNIALEIVAEGGVHELVHLGSSSVSKMVRFLAALALAYMFDGRIDEFAPMGTSSESTSHVSFNGARKMALKHIQAFILSFFNLQAFATGAAASSDPAALAHATENARLQKVEQWIYSEAEIPRLVSMLQNSSSILQTFAAFALLQFSRPGSRQAVDNAMLIQGAGAESVLRALATTTTSPIVTKIFARIVLRNLEHYQVEHSI